jgi:hypothetical protein
MRNDHDMDNLKQNCGIVVIPSSSEPTQEGCAQCDGLPLQCAKSESGEQGTLLIIMDEDNLFTASSHCHLQRLMRCSSACWER